MKFKVGDKVRDKQFPQDGIGTLIDCNYPISSIVYWKVKFDNTPPRYRHNVSRIPEHDLELIIEPWEIWKKLNE